MHVRLAMKGRGWNGKVHKLKAGQRPLYQLADTLGRNRSDSVTGDRMPKIHLARRKQRSSATSAA